MKKALFLFVMLAVVGSVSGSTAYAVNRAPYFIEPRDDELAVEVEEEVAFGVFAADPDFDAVTYKVFNLPEGAVFDARNRSFFWRPTINQAGRYNISLRAADATLSTDKLVTIVVDGPVNRPAPSNTSVVNPAPAASVSVANLQFIDFNPPLVTVEGQLYSYFVKTTGASGLVNYRLAKAPAGMIIGATTGMISWTPNASQGRSEPYAVTVAATDIRTEISRSFNLAVNDFPVQSPVSKTVYVDRGVSDKLKIYDLRIESGQGKEVFVIWGTNKPATGRVIYGTKSQANKEDGFSYENATAEDRDLTAIHKIKLGELEPNVTYYLRAVSKTVNESAVSLEGVIIQLPGGELRAFGLAAALAAFGGFILGHPFLLFFIIVVVAFVLVYRRKNAL